MGRALQANRFKIRDRIFTRTLEDDIPLKEEHHIIEEIPDISIWRMNTHNNSLVV